MKGQQRMSVSVQFNGNKFLSSKEASRVFGYSSDYIARLARQEKITATRIGHQWFVEPTSLGKFLMESSEENSVRLKKLSDERKQERAVFNDISSTSSVLHQENFSQNSNAHSISIATVFAGLLLAFVPYISVPTYPSIQSHILSFTTSLKQTAFGLHQTLSLADLEETQVASVYTGIAPVEATAHDAVTYDSTQNQLNGLVVFPDSASASSTIKKIENSFSDKVEVKENPDDPLTGTIVPVFKNKRSSEEFRYVIVPVQSPP